MMPDWLRGWYRAWLIQPLGAETEVAENPKRMGWWDPSVQVGKQRPERGREGLLVSQTTWLLVAGWGRKAS